MSKFRVQKAVFSLSLTHAGAATIVSSSSTQINGILRHVKIIAPATVDGGATLTVDVLDAGGDVVYTKSGVAAAARSINLLTQDLSVPLSGFYTVRATFSAAQTVTDTVTGVELLTDRG